MKLPRFAGSLLLCMMALTHAWADAPPKVVTVNPAFAQGLDGWQVSGDVHLQTGASGVREVVLGPGAGSISQRVAIAANNHMQVSATIHSDSAGVGKLTVRLFDRNGNELMSLKSGEDIQPDSRNPDELSDYFRPHPLTASVEIVISKDATPGTVTVSRAELAVYGDDNPALHSTQNVAELMKPFWQGNTVTGEAVLMESFSGRPATGTLMFRPARVLSVTNYDGSVTYQEGRDYTVEGRTLTATPNSRMIVVRDADLKHGDLAWNIIGGEQVLVNYEHSDQWPGPVQPYVGDGLPNTIGKLRDRAPLTIVAFGDSITYGIGSSHMRQIPPYQEPWIDLFAQQLRSDTADPSITLYNSSQSGAASDWARNMAARMVANLHPDLVIIAFGQNDFWRISANDFAANIAAVMQTVRATNPNAEFLLVSTLRFDPAYTTNAGYWDLVSQYDARLRAMTGPGVQLVDMTNISGAVYAAKSPKDCLNDPLHPDDYFARWYAQSLIAALVDEHAPNAAGTTGAAR